MEVNFSERFKELRILYNYTQHEVADGINIKRPTYQAYEEKRSIPPVPTLFSIASFYRFTSLDEFLGISPSTTKITPIEKAYYSLPLDRRKIIDFILNLNY
jgi:transcriptional regulator with XRE-family HTH domain